MSKPTVEKNAAGYAVLANKGHSDSQISVYWRKDIKSIRAFKSAARKQGLLSN